MTLQEFTDRTGFHPTEDYYHCVIEEEYYRSKLDKDAWCKQWKKEGGIQRAYNELAAEHRNLFEFNLELNSKETKLNNCIEELDKDLKECRKTLGQAKIDLDKANAAQDGMAAFLIEQSCKWSAPDLRDKTIEMIGAKAYLAYKIENNLSLWDEDRQLLIETLNKD